MTRRQDIVLGSAIVVWLLFAAILYLGVQHARYSDTRCGRVGGCYWMEGT